MLSWFFIILHWYCFVSNIWSHFHSRGPATAFVSLPDGCVVGGYAVLAVIENAYTIHLSPLVVANTHWWCLWLSQCRLRDYKPEGSRPHEVKSLAALECSTPCYTVTPSHSECWSWPGEFKWVWPMSPNGVLGLISLWEDFSAAGSLQMVTCRYFIDPFI